MTNDELKRWARAAVRCMLAGCIRGLEAELACEMRLVQDAKRRLGL